MKGVLRSRAGLVLCVFMAGALVLVWLEHRVHLAGALPLVLLLLLCVGMHLFLHRGHGGRSGGPEGRHDGR